MESIEMKIAKIAAENWGQKTPKNLEEAKGITWGSEVSAVKGIVEVLKLNPEIEEKIVDDVYSKDVLSEDIASVIKTKGVKPKDVVEMLSVIHDGWVKSNPNKFMQEGRNKEYQFAPLMLLDWKEVKSDLLFLKPILEGAGIELDEKDIQEQFDIMQKDFIIKNKIFSIEKLKENLSRGAKFYTALEGLETQNGGNIEYLLQNPDIVERMAEQINDRVPIKSREDIAVDIIKSANKNLDEMFWIETSRDGIGETQYFPTINGPISKREIMLSKTIGKPYPTYILGTKYNDKMDEYTTSLREPKDAEWDAVSLVENSIKKRKKNAETLEVHKKGKVKLGLIYNIRIPGKMDGEIIISDKELLSAGLDLEKMGWEEVKEQKRSRISRKDIAEADEKTFLTTTEVGIFGRLINKSKEKVQGKGEK